MEDEPTSNDERQAGKEHKVKRPAYMSLESNVKDVAPDERDDTRNVENGELDEDGGKEDTEENNADGEVASGTDGEDENDDPGSDERSKVDPPSDVEAREEEESTGDKADKAKDGSAVDQDRIEKKDNKETSSEGDTKIRIESEEIPSKEKVRGERGPKDRSDSKPAVRSEWHDASRDWKICSGIIGSLLIIFMILLSRLDVLKHDMIILFVGVFIAFLAIVFTVFLVGIRRVEDYQSRFFFYKHNPIKFLEFLQYEIVMKREIRMDEIEPISGHTFGLLIPKRIWKLSTGEIIEVNLFKGPFASFVYSVPIGMTLGLYLLVKAPADSPVWGILEELIQKKGSYDSLKL